MANRNIKALLRLPELRKLKTTDKPVELIDSLVQQQKVIAGVLTPEEANNLTHYVLGELKLKTGGFNTEAQLPKDKPSWFTPSESDAPKKAKRSR